LETTEKIRRRSRGIMTKDGVCHAWFVWGIKVGKKRVKKLQRMENKEMESCMEQKRKGSVGLEGIAKEAAKREEEELRY